MKDESALRGRLTAPCRTYRPMKQLECFTW
jgi:hypothetical protein